MADVLKGKVFTLGSGTLGEIVTTPLIIDKIRITWSGASAGNVVLNDTDGQTILIAQTLALASGNIGFATQEFDMGNQTFFGLTKTAMTGVAGEVGVQIQLR